METQRNIVEFESVGIIHLPNMFIRKSHEAKAEGSSPTLKPFSRKLHRGPLPGSTPEDNDEEQFQIVPEDVPAGHFVVMATKGGEVKRFIVELRYLSEPAFLRLLEKAKEEYGFGQKGALTVPCRPQELQRILRHRRRKAGSCAVCIPCDNPMINSF